MKNHEPLPIDRKTLNECDQPWVKVEGGLTEYKPELRRKVGLYRVLRGRRIMFIGMGVEKKGGLAKRLSDLHRTSPSGRDYRAGRLIYEHRHSLVVEVLIISSDMDGRMIRELKDSMIQLHKPPWNVRVRSPRAFIRQPKGRPKKAGVVSKPRPYTGTILDW
jgi:hypothetical protein